MLENCTGKRCVVFSLEFPACAMLAGEFYRCCFRRNRFLLSSKLCLLFRLLPTPQNNKTVTMIIMLVIFASDHLLVFTIRMFLRITGFHYQQMVAVPAILADWILYCFWIQPEISAAKVSFSMRRSKRAQNPRISAGQAAGRKCLRQSGNGLSIRLKERTIKRLTGKKRATCSEILPWMSPMDHGQRLLGGSGAGKTTFVNAVIGYEKANAEVSNGTDVHKHYDKMKYRIGFIAPEKPDRGNDTVMRTVTDAAQSSRIPSDVPQNSGRRGVKRSWMDAAGASPGAGPGIQIGGQLRRISIAMELS